MKEQNHDVSNEEVKEIVKFWYSLFPEVKDEQEVSELLKCISHKTEEDYVKQYNELDAKKDTYIDLIFESLNQIDSKDKLEIEQVLVELHKNCKWSYFYEPVLCMIYIELKEAIDYCSLIENKKKFLIICLEQLIQKMVNVSYRTILQEVALTKEEGKLEGENVEERITYFDDVLLKNSTYIIDTYKSYSELIRILELIAENTTRFIKKVLNETEEKIDLLNQTFASDQDFGGLLSLELDKGDTHNHGSSVCKLEFSHQTLIYKPRTLGMEYKYNQLLHWLNEEVNGFKPIYTAKVIQNAESGWMEFIDNDPCESEREVAEFYVKMGQILCILYTLNSKDFHFENVIAKGNSPVLIDLETLVNVRLEKNKTDIIGYIADYIQDSVIGTALLPSLLPNRNTDEVLEVGALGICKEQKSPFKTHVLKEDSTEESMLGTHQMVIKCKKNFPILNENGVGCEEYLQQVLDGFELVYTWILEHKDIYLKKITELFESERCRIICKNTNMYIQLLSTSYHPSLLYNKVDREVYFHRLGLMIPSIKDFVDERLYRIEIESMLESDVPMFYAYVNGKELMYGSDDLVGIKCAESALQGIQRKIESMDHLEGKRQKSLIYESFIGCRIKTDLNFYTKSHFYQNQELQEKQDGDIDIEMACNHLILEETEGIEDNRLEMARNLADLCMTRCHEYQGTASYIGMMGFGENYYQIIPVGFDLYSGNVGIAIFFLELGRKCEDDRYIEFTRKLIMPIISDIKEQLEYGYAYSYSTFEGLVGEIYLLCYMIQKNMYSVVESICTEEELYYMLRGTIEIVWNHKSEIRGLDLLSGAAGVLGVMLTIHGLADFYDYEICNKVIEHLVDRILENAVEHDDGTITFMENEDIGYAHGNAGIITQLARYYSITQNNRVISYIEKALEFERCAKYDKVNRRWKLGEKIHYASWCNGIAGMLLSKVELVEILPDKLELKSEILELLDQVIELGFGENHSICHGDIGSVLIIQYVAKKLKNERLIQQCEKFKIYYANSYVKDKWMNFECTEDWGLMVGIAGLGLGLFDTEDSIIDVLYLR